MDYAMITADPVRGPEIGRLYLEASPFVTTLARHAYRRFAEQVGQQYCEMIKDIRVTFTDDDPYGDYREMIADVNRGRLAVYATQPDQSHPLLTPTQNNAFRAVHDYYGHHGAGNGCPVSFSRHGEEAAWIRHSRMFTGLARRAMTSETRGQNSAFIWVNGGREFPEQKAILLPDWVSVIPDRWAR
jgi:hypothetical protein